MPLSPLAIDQRRRLVETRRDLHRHPELGFEETRTAALVAERLRAAGLDPREGIARTGVVTRIAGGAAGPRILVRADMDALPIHEENDVPYRSEAAGRMHACGHDGHTAIALSLADLLQARRAELRGEVTLLFQPAEEGPGGAKPMIEAGALAGERPVERAIGLHLSTRLEVGKVCVDDGPIMAAVDCFTLTVRGRGGHGARPNDCRDPIVAACQVVTALQTIVSREASPLDSAVVTIGAIEGGKAFNVIPEEVRLLGSVRTYSEALRDGMQERILRIAEGVAGALGCTAALDYERRYPATVNDPDVAALIRAAAAEVVGPENVVSGMQGMWSEDFSYYGREAPACFFFVGARNEARGLVHEHHSPRFDFDEEALVIGLDVFQRALVG